MDVQSKTCPKCNGQLKYLPPIGHTGFLAYFGGEFTFWIVAALVAGTISGFASENFALAYILGGVAAFCVFILIYRAGVKSSRGSGLFYCEKCQYYHHPERIVGEKSAI